MKRGRRKSQIRPLKVALIIEHGRLRQVIAEALRKEPDVSLVLTAAGPVEAALAWSEQPDVVISDQVPRSKGRSQQAKRKGRGAKGQGLGYGAGQGRR